MKKNLIIIGNAFLISLFLMSTNAISVFAEMDEVSIETDDVENVEEAIDNFGKIIDSQNETQNRKRSIVDSEDDTLKIAPLEGPMIKMVRLEQDIVEVLARDEKISFDDVYIYYQSLTEEGQVATFSLIDDVYQLNTVTFVDNGKLSVDLDEIHLVISNNNLDRSKVHYIVTGYSSDLTLVYFEEIEEFLAFYTEGDYIQGIENNTMYARDSLVEIFRNLLTEIDEKTEHEEELIGVSLPNTDENQEKIVNGLGMYSHPTPYVISGTVMILSAIFVSKWNPKSKKRN